MSRVRAAILMLLGIAVFVAVGIVLEEQTGLPIDTTYRIGCATASLAMMAKFANDSEDARWPWIAVAIATPINIAILVSPLMDHPTSRGEFLIFAAPDAAIFLAVRAFTYPTSTVHHRAVRQQLIVGLIVALGFVGIILSTGLMPEAKPLNKAADPAPSGSR